MSNLVIAILSTVALTGSTPPGAPPPLPSHFQIQLAHTLHGWAARCEKGCHWKSAAFTCPRDCAAIVDANGLVTAATPREEATPFSFTVEWAGSGWTARSTAGASWATLAWGCSAPGCAAQIDDAGVSPGTPLR